MKLPKFSQHFYLINGAIIFVGLLIFLYFHFYLPYSEFQKVGQNFQKYEWAPTPTTPLPPIPAIDTSTWKTYENKIHGFSFKYPSIYISTYEDDRKMTNSYLTTIHSSDYVVNKEELVYTHGTAFYYVDIKNSQCSEIKNLVSSTPTFKLINTGGLKNTIIFEVNDKLGSQFPYRGALVSINNKCIEMYCNSTKQGCTDNELGKEFTQILSTFKFSEPANYTCPPSDYVGCMPDGSGKVNPECTPEAMNWYKTNCPDFKGAAL
jgi:hypothetical protein